MKLKNLLIIGTLLCGMLLWASESGYLSHESDADANPAAMLAQTDAPQSPPKVAQLPEAAETAMDTEAAEKIISSKPVFASSEESSKPAFNNSGKAIDCDMGPGMDAAALGEEILAMTLDIPAKAANEKPEDADNAVIAGVVEHGDTVGKILGEAAEGRVQHYINAMRKVFSPASVRPGQPYTVITDQESGRVKRFEYEINSLRRLVVEGVENPRARLEDIQYNTVLEICAGVIEDNLFLAVSEAGEKPELAVRLAALFGSEINFVRDLQQGDSFVVLHEKKYRDGHNLGYGRILAARFTNRGKTYEAFLFRDAQDQPHYYNSQGESLKKTLLQAPLAITRMTSKFSHSRKHPILGKSRPHLGVDYGAPTGTPVKAVGDGVVTKRGWAGGYGNQIIIRHSSDLESLYAHLSRYANGLRPGQKVRQGQVIGYVGSTGLSTGPHLDFRLRQKGVFINPAKAINPRANPVSRGMMNAFMQAMAQERAYLDGHRLPRNYTVNSLVPLNVASKGDEADFNKAAQSKKTKAKSGRRKNAKASAKKRS